MTDTSRLKECWQGRVDIEDADMSRRLHQHLNIAKPDDNFSDAPVILGFATDAGVKRNQGRTGAKDGPDAIRKALANHCCSSDFSFFDVGDISCDGDALEASQQQTANAITDILRNGGRPRVLGGGHEIGWSSFLGIQQFLQETSPEKALGILNFDAHFDLRNPEPVTSSGTPFRQAQQWCEVHDKAFHYFVVGLNPSANSDALFEFAYDHDVQWVEDLDCHWQNLDQVKQQLRDWLSNLDVLYLTLCLDVFPAADAPGVSAPAGVGIETRWALKLLQFIQEACENSGTEIILADVAELNPSKDIDGRTAKLAARYIYQLML